MVGLDLIGLTSIEWPFRWKSLHRQKIIAAPANDCCVSNSRVAQIRFVRIVQIDGETMNVRSGSVFHDAMVAQIRETTLHRDHDVW